jgi:hypothetical protein
MCFLHSRASVALSMLTANFFCPLAAQYCVQRNNNQHTSRLCSCFWYLI